MKIRRLRSKFNSIKRLLESILLIGILIFIILSLSREVTVYIENGFKKIEYIQVIEDRGEDYFKEGN